MSRAAKKRRKERSKSDGTPGHSNSSTHTANDDNDNEDEDDDDKVAPRAKKVKASVTMDELNRADLDSDGVDNDSLRLELPLREILVLEDGTDIDCRTRAASILSILLSPYDRTTFYTQYWEKRPLHCKRGSELDKRKAVKGLLSSKQYRELIRSQSISYGVDVETSKQRQTVKKVNHTADDDEDDNNTDEGNNDDEGDGDDEPQEAKESELWALYKDGYTVRLLCPQKFHDPLWSLLSSLEFEFSSRVGCFADYTPPGGKGFPPGSNTFDLIVVQLEGQSRWRLTDTRPTLDGVGNGGDKTTVNAILQAGDTMYVPKGWLHRQDNLDSQVPGEGSLNITIHVNDGDVTSMATYIETFLPEAMSEAFQQHPTMKRAQPRGLYSFMGVAASENDEDHLRVKFQDLTQSLMLNVVDRAMGMLDAATDQAAKSFLGARLPIPLSSLEEKRTAAGAPGAIIASYTRLRMVRPGVARAIVEEGMVVVYHCMDNARELYGTPLQPLEFELDDGPAIEALLLAYPDGVTVSELPHPSEELDDKVSVAQALFKEGFLLIDDEASRPDDEDDEDDSPF